MMFRIPPPAIAMRLAEEHRHDLLKAAGKQPAGSRAGRCIGPSLAVPDDGGRRCRAPFNLHSGQARDGRRGSPAYQSSGAASPTILATDGIALDKATRAVQAEGSIPKRGQFGLPARLLAALEQIWVTLARGRCPKGVVKRQCATRDDWFSRHCRPLPNAGSSDSTLQARCHCRAAGLIGFNLSEHPGPGWKNWARDGPGPAPSGGARRRSAVHPANALRGNQSARRGLAGVRGIHSRAAQLAVLEGLDATG